MSAAGCSDRCRVRADDGPGSMTGRRSGPEQKGRAGALGDLVVRLESRDVLRSVLAGPSAVAQVQVRGVTHDSRRVEPGGSSWPSRVSTMTVTTTRQRRSPPVPSPWSWNAPSPSRGCPRCWSIHPGVRWRWRRRGSSAIPATSWASWASPAPTARPPRRTSCARCSRPPGWPPGMLGTIDVVVGGQSLGNPGRATTPEAPELQGLLRRMVDAGDRWAVIEADVPRPGPGTRG